MKLRFNYFVFLEDFAETEILSDFENIFSRIFATTSSILMTLIKSPSISMLSSKIYLNVDIVVQELL